MARYFVDSNLVVYANDRRDPEKQARALEVVTQLMTAGNGVLSIQVLQEYANTALAKLEQEPQVVIRQIKLLDCLTTIAPSPASVRRTVEVRNTYRISFWDAAIVVAAEAGECDIILSEDLNAGQYYAGIQVANPFGEGFDTSALCA